MDDQAWDDADVERFLARLGECGIRPFLIEGSEREDPKDAVDFDPPDGAGFDPVIALVFLGHRRDLACWLRGLRGEARKAAVADARAEARRQFAPLARWLAEAAPGANIRLSGVPLDQVPDDDDRGMPQ
jgi:hypothetical protein